MSLVKIVDISFFFIQKVAKSDKKVSKNDNPLVNVKNMCFNIDIKIIDLKF